MRPLSAGLASAMAASLGILCTAAGGLSAGLEAGLTARRALAAGVLCGLLGGASAAAWPSGPKESGGKTGVGPPGGQG